MNKYVLIIFCFAITSIIASSQTYTVSGYLFDEISKEVLISATVYETGSSKGTSTNSYGFYSLRLPKGNVKLVYRYLGYKNLELEFHLAKDTLINARLSRSAVELEAVTITAGSNSVDNVRIGAVNIPINKIKTAPVLFGESDLMKSLQYIPGVRSSSEGRSELTIRGGSPDQNLILLDGNPIYNVSHVFGFLSVFNTDALKKLTLYKSGVPARFGGRLSSVIDINTKDGNKEQFFGSASLGLLALKLNIEGPIVKDKTSFTFSARRSYADLFMVKLQELSKEDEQNKNISNFFFYDLNAKFHHKFNDKTSLYLMAYNGRDKLLNSTKGSDVHDDFVNLKTFKLKTVQDWKWGSTIFASRLNSAISKNLFINSTLSFNNYKYSTSIDKRYSLIKEENSTDMKDYLHYESGIRDYTARLDLEYTPISSHDIRLGTECIYHDFKPEALNQTTSDASTPSSSIGSKNINATEFSFYAEDDWELSRKLKLNLGARFSMFNVNKRNYATIDPRVSLRYKITENMSVKAGYSQMQQYIHLLSNNSLLLQTDLWLPATDKVEPMNATQYSIAWHMVLPDLFDISVESYYKTMNKIIEYKDGASFVGQSGAWEDKVEAGVGRAYGVEFSLEKEFGKTTGSVSYAWAKTERKFTNINFAEWFPAKYDRRHNLFLTASHQLNKKIDLTLSWCFASGDMMTLPLMSVETPVIPDTQPTEHSDLTQLDYRNNYRLPSYHRLDIGMSYTHRKRERNYGVWNFSIYNLYNQMNPFKLYIETDVDSEQNGKNVYTKKLKQFTHFPILPSISYTYNF